MSRRFRYSLLSDTFNISNATLANVVFTNSTYSNLFTSNVNTGISTIYSGSFLAANNVVSAADITGLSFSSSITRSWNATVTVSVLRSSGGNLFETFTLEGFQTDAGWTVLTSSYGDTTGILFTITSAGQVQYTSSNQSNWTSTTIRFSVTQIANTGTYSDLSFVTSGNIITNTIQLNNTNSAVSGSSVGALYSLGGVTLERNLVVNGGLISISNSNTIGSIFTTGGNVGINTTTPASRLDVSGGSMRISSTVDYPFNINQSFTGAGGYPHFGQAINPSLATNDAYNFVMGQNNSARNAGYIGFIYATAGSNVNCMTIGLNNVDRILNVTGAGNVGIGTTAPTTALDIISGTANTPFLRIGNANGGVGNQVGIQLSPFSNRTGGASSQIISIDDGNSSAHLTIWTAPTGTSSTSVERLRITNAGNVGINTTAPATPLHIQTMSNAYGLRHSDGTIQLHTYVGGSINGAYVGTDSAHPLGLYTSGTAAKLTVQTNGNVGIGTTSPGSTLTVNGNVTINSTLTCGNQAMKFWYATGTHSGSLNGTVTPSTPSGLSAGNIISIVGVTFNTNGDCVPFNYSMTDTAWNVDVFVSASNVISVTARGSTVLGKTFRITIITSA